MDYVEFVDEDTNLSVATIRNPDIIPKDCQYITLNGKRYQCVSDPEFNYNRLENIRLRYSAIINVRKVG